MPLPMKEVFSAVIPHLKKINWRLDAEAFLSTTGWFIVEENGFGWWTRIQVKNDRVI
jgi:hypothetical protein